MNCAALVQNVGEVLKRLEHGGRAGSAKVVKRWADQLDTDVTTDALLESLESLGRSGFEVDGGLSPALVRLVAKCGASLIDVQAGLPDDTLVEYACPSCGYQHRYFRAAAEPTE